MRCFNLDNIGIVIGIIFCALAVIAWGRVISGRFKAGASHPKRVKATVVNKQTYVTETFAAKLPSYPRRYVITFLCGDRNVYLDVSPETYDRLRLKQTGTLVYCGSRFYDFN